MEFAAEVGITQRMEAYYEEMAQALGVSVDVLLGLAEPRRPKTIATIRLERRLLEIEKLDPKTKCQITQLPPGLSALCNKAHLNQWPFIRLDSAELLIS